MDSSYLYSSVTLRYSSIIGPKDILLSMHLTMPWVPLFDWGWASTHVSVWDVAAAHLLLEDALRNRPQDVRGQSFLITGPGEAWSFARIRHSVKVALVPSVFSLALMI